MNILEYEQQNRVTEFAITNWRDDQRSFGIKEKDRHGHMYMIGKTGTGKSTLMKNMAISDIRRGNGLALIDPHGDLAEEIMEYVPEGRINDVVYFNPADMDRPLAINLLEKVNPDSRHLVASGLISAFKKFWSESWGPRLEHILRNAILALLEYPQSTLLDMPRFLTDKGFRRHVLEFVENQQVKNFWLMEFEKYSAIFKSEAVSPVLNKVGQFLTSIPLRNIVGQKESSFDFRKIMDEKKILIVNLSKGKIGEDNCSLLGSLITARIQMAAMSRADIPEDERKSFYLYVDEFHNFFSLSFADILSEARKYGLHMILAHQYIQQLDERISAAVFGNVGTIISFRLGIEDARVLANEFAPVFSETDFTNLPNHHIYLKLMIDGFTSRPFSAVTLNSLVKAEAFKDKIIEISRERYGRPREEVERGILMLQFRVDNKQSALF